MATDSIFNKLKHPDVPASIHLRSMVQLSDLTGSERRERERQDGDRLLYHLLHTCTPYDSWSLDRQDGCKPVAMVESVTANLSLAHTPELLAAAISLEWELGIDLEPVGRTLPAALARRIFHPEERAAWDETRNEELLKLWTLKEAALKQCGTGLRTRMNHVRVLPVRPDAYEISVADREPVQALCWQEQNHWVSLAWGNEGE